MKSLLTVGAWLGALGVLVAMPPLKQETYGRGATLALTGDRDAQVLTGQAFERGRFGRVDPGAAASIYLEAARAGDLVALDGLVRLIGEAKVDGAAATEAFTILRAAAAKGDRESQFNLACLLWNGVGGPRDTREAAQWLKVAAAGGDADATLFWDYLVSDVAVQSSRELGLRAKFADVKLDRASANYLRGVVAEEGWQAERDPAVAVQKYRLAAEADQPAAMVRLGILLMEGRLVAQDLPEAYVLLHRAAERGVAQAVRYSDLAREAMTVEQWDATGVKLLAISKR